MYCMGSRSKSFRPGYSLALSITQGNCVIIIIVTRWHFTCCGWRQFPGGRGGSAEGFGYHLLPLGEGGGQGCFGTTRGCRYIDGIHHKT